jgi:hypothetical protein
VCSPIDGAGSRIVIANLKIRTQKITYICEMIFKKQISILIAFLVLISSSGLAFNVHFCEGKIASVSSVFTKDDVCEIPVRQDEACCSKVETSHKKCCSDKEVSLKDKAEKVLVKISLDYNVLFVFTELSPMYFGWYSQIASFGNLSYYCDANAPPFYQLYCQYTYYA